AVSDISYFGEPAKSTNPCVPSPSVIRIFRSSLLVGKFSLHSLLLLFVHGIFAFIVKSAKEILFSSAFHPRGSRSVGLQAEG
ncbi:hypothetical protein LINPERPRIM_LOCUS32952, partial [Linum perenne]